MTYAALAAGFLAAAVLFAVLLRRRARAGGLSWAAVGIAGAALLVLTAVFDSIMIALGLFTYDPALISGIRVGEAPIEDFAYPLAVVIALPVLWSALRRPQAVRAGTLLRHAWTASRPVSWINTAFPFAAALLLSTGEIDALLVVGALYYLIPYNLAMYGINDVFDYASDLANPRKGGIEGALLPPAVHRPMLWLAVASNVPFLIVLAAAGGPATWIALAVSTFALVAYSAPRLRFKERPVLDSLTSSTHFVSPAVVGLTLAGGSVPTPVLLSLVAFFLWGMAAHAFGAVQDIAPDRDAGIGSIATVFGARGTVRLALLLWAAAGALMLWMPWPASLLAVVAVPYLINALPFVAISDADAGQTNRAWRRFLWMNYLSGFLVTLVLIAVWFTAR